MASPARHHPLRCKLSRILVAVLLFAGAKGSGAQPPPEETPPPVPASELVERPPPQQRTLLGSRSAIRPHDRPTLQLPPGTRVYAEADARSQVVLRLDVDTEVELLEESDARSPSGWRQVRVGSVRGWVAPPGSSPVAADFWSEPTPAARKLRIERHKRLYQLLGEPARLGPFELFTDIVLGSEGDELLQSLASVAGDFSRAYRARYGLTLPSEMDDLSVVMFAGAEAYRHYVAVELGREDSESAGISPPGLAVLFVGERSFADVAAVLIHELVHVFNRELFGDRLPPWLEEGMAEDLSYHPLDPKGRLLLGQLPKVERTQRQRLGRGGRVIIERSQYTPSSLHEMACAIAAWPARGGPDLGALSELTAAEFAVVEGRKQRYAESALLVRYLLDAAGEAASRRFLALLASAAEQRAFDAAGWSRQLAMPSAELSAALGRWGRRKVSPQLCQR